jgi:hypothetical protein
MTTEHSDLDTKPLFDRLAPSLEPGRAESVVERSVRAADRRRRLRRAALATPAAAVLVALVVVVTSSREGTQRVQVADAPGSTMAPDDAAVLVEATNAGRHDLLAGVALGPELVVAPHAPVSGARSITVRAAGTSGREATVAASVPGSYLAVLHVPGLPGRRAALAPPMTEPGPGATLLTLDPSSLARRRVPVSLNPATKATGPFMAGLLGVRADLGDDLPVAVVDSEDRVVALPVGAGEGELIAVRTMPVWSVLSSVAAEGQPNVAPGRAHPYTFSIHCGFGPLRFNGRWWKPIDAPPVAIRQPEPTGPAVPLVENVAGEAWLSAPDELTFRADNTVERLELRYEPTTPPEHGCL